MCSVDSIIVTIVLILIIHITNNNNVCRSFQALQSFFDSFMFQVFENQGL